LFRGQYSHSISKSGRVSMPAKFRDTLIKKYSNKKIVISLFENCLISYPIKEWEKLELKISKLPSFKNETVEFERYLVGNANECSIDSEGRINIPPLLRKKLNIKDTVIFVGILNRFEIWCESTWNNYMKNSFKKFQKSRNEINGI
tara:strand:- start:546 stop:983 length:438 start_codon:yes stop_codon:yes gene_type:complete